MKLKPFKVDFNILFRHKDNIKDELWLDYHKENMTFEEAERLIRLLFTIWRKAEEEGYEQHSTWMKSFEVYWRYLDWKETSLTIDTTLKDKEWIIDFSKEKEDYVIQHLKDHAYWEWWANKRDKFLLKKKEKEEEKNK